MARAKISARKRVLIANRGDLYYNGRGAKSASFPLFCDILRLGARRYAAQGRSEENMVTKSEGETMRFAEEYAKTLSAGDVVLLHGEMGAGKTVFVKGLASGLGIEDEITSPTYAYMNDYGGLYHYDCYRLKSGAQAEALGLTDYFYAGGICVVEWSENIADVLPEGCKEVFIRKTGENEREILCK